MLLEAISAIFLGTQLIKEAATPKIPAENWRNWKLMNEDKLNPNISPEQVMKNLANGKYYLPDVPPNAVIDDMEAYNNDMKHYRFDEVYRFAQQGKYNSRYKNTTVKKDDNFDFIPISFASLDNLEYCFNRACRALDNGKDVVTGWSSCWGKKTNEKVIAAYNNFVQDLKNRYGERVVVTTEPNDWLRFSMKG